MTFIILGFLAWMIIEIARDIHKEMNDLYAQDSREYVRCEFQ